MSHWQQYPRHWALIKPPLRPHADVVARLQNLVGSHRNAVLLLGVTPEIAEAFDTIDAVDNSPAMISAVWPGDSPSKRAVEGDWLELTGPEEGFDAIIGDGSINALTSLKDIEKFFRIVLRLLKPDACFACRLFERPAIAFEMDDLLRSAASRGLVNFHAFKWQLAMHLAEYTSSTVRVELIGQRFNEMFPDRDELAQRTGWSRKEIDTIDVYQGSPMAYSFPNRVEYQQALPPGISGVEFQACGDYDLAHSCPILTFRKA